MNASNAIIVAVLVALVPGVAAAQTTLYKLIDKNGKVTYVDTPPKNFDGQVIPVDIDTKRNSATIKPAVQPPTNATSVNSTVHCRPCSRKPG